LISCRGYCGRTFPYAVPDASDDDFWCPDCVLALKRRPADAMSPRMRRLLIEKAPGMRVRRRRTRKIPTYVRG
jgi:hypothetical protein